MRVNATFTFDASKFIDAMQKAMDKGVVASAQVAVQVVRSRIGSNHGGVASKGWGPWNTQTGNARRSIVAVKTGPRRAGFGTNVAYVRHLEYGAISKPKSGKNLVIPVGTGKKLFRNRRPRAVFDDLKAKKLLFFLKRGTKWVAMEKYGKTGKRSRPIAVLQESARIAPRPMFRPLLADKAVHKRMEDTFVRVARIAVTQAGSVVP